MKWLPLVAAAFSALAQPALASQEMVISADAPQPADVNVAESPADGLTVARLNRMCSPAGMMQYSFGQKNVPGSSRAEQLMRQGFSMPDTYAPFTAAKPRATDWSAKLMKMSYTFKVADKTEGEAKMEVIASLVDQTDWNAISIPEEEMTLLDMGSAGWATYEKPVVVDGVETKLRLSIDQFAGEVILDCVRMDLLELQFNEAFGKLPPGTPRPPQPEVDIPENLSLASCEQDDVQARMVEMMASREFQDEFAGKMLERASYRDRLTTWMIWKIDQSGKIEAGELVNFMFNSLGSASPGGNPFAALERILDLMPILDRMGKASDSEDPKAFCTSMVAFQDWIVEVDAITLAQTEAMHKALEAKAASLEVSLE